MTPNDLQLLLRAADFAAFKHRDQRRKGERVPYVNHPLGVARLLAETGGVTDPVTLTAAMLHDTVEDTDTTRDELEREFGAAVADVVAEVSDDQSLSKVARKRAQIDHAHELSDRARLVKLADKLHNLRDLRRAPPPSWEPARVRGYFCWAHAVVERVGPVNDGLWRALEEIFAGELTFGDVTVRAVPRDPHERDALLHAYYATLAVPKGR